MADFYYFMAAYLPMAGRFFTSTPYCLVTSVFCLTGKAPFSASL